MIIEGEWFELFHGVPKCHFGIKRFQGIGKTTREAKFQACTGALNKLKETMPGFRVRPGVVPDEWYQWLLTNLRRGADVKQLLSALTAKGFQPQYNLHIMQLLGAWESYKQFRHCHPEAVVSDLNRELYMHSCQATRLLTCC